MVSALEMHGLRDHGAVEPDGEFFVAFESQRLDPGGRGFRGQPGKHLRGQRERPYRVRFDDEGGYPLDL